MLNEECGSVLFNVGICLPIDFHLYECEWLEMQVNAKKFHILLRSKV